MTCSMFFAVRKLRFERLKKVWTLRIVWVLILYFGCFDDPSPTNYLVITNEDILCNVGIFGHINVLIAAQEPKMNGVFKRGASSVWQWNRMAVGGLPLLNKEIPSSKYFAAVGLKDQDA